MAAGVDSVAHRHKLVCVGKLHGVQFLNSRSIQVYEQQGSEARYMQFVPSFIICVIASRETPLTLR